MISYPIITFQDLMKRVEGLGFYRVRQKGSHIAMFIQMEERQQYQIMVIKMYQKAY